MSRRGIRFNALFRFVFTNSDPECAMHFRKVEVTIILFSSFFDQHPDSANPVQGIRVFYSEAKICSSQDDPTMS